MMKKYIPTEISEFFPDLFFSLDREGMFLDGDFSRTPSLFPTREKLIGQSIEQVLPGKIATAAKDRFDDAMSSGLEKYFEFSVDGPGWPTQFEARFFPVRQDRVIMVLRDITQKARFRGSVDDEKEQYRNMFERYPVPMMVVDVDTLRFLNVNDATVDHYGYSRDEFLGFTIWDIRPPEEVKGAAHRIQSMEGKDEHLGIWKHRRKDGTVILVDILSHEIIYEKKSARLVRCNDVTEQIRGREALAESEEKFRSIVESSPMGIHMYRIDEDGQLRFVGANPAADKILNVKNSQFIGLTIEKAFPSANNTEIPEKYREAAIKGTPWYTEQVDYEDEKVRGAFEVFAFGTGHGTMAAMFQEITDRKKAEEALVESEEKFRTAFNTSPDSITLSRLEDGVFLEVNDGFFSLTGYTRKEIIGKSSLQIDLWVDTDQRMELLERIGTAGKVENFEIVMKMKDNSTKTALLSARSILLDGAPHLLSVSRDITEIKKQREALSSSEEKFRAAFETSPDSILIVDQENRVIRDVNQGFVTTTGFSREEVRGSSSDDFGIWETASDRDRFYEAVGEEGTTDGFEANFRLKDGSVRRGLLSARTLNLSGNPHLLVTVRDITGLMEAHQQLRASLAEKEVLLREIHHRVKNNLQVVSGLLELQSRHVTDPGSRLIYKESQSRIIAMSLIHEELYQTDDLARVYFPHYIQTLCDNLMLSYGVGKERIQLIIEAQETNIVVDTAIPCGLIVNELVTNALKHAFPDGRKGQIHLNFRRLPGEKYELIVSDDGIGIPGNLNIDDLPSLGMQIVSILVQQMGGTIEMKKEKGTVFRVTFGEYYEAGTTLY